ncbi:MFS monocarboxylate transporter [Rhodotorula toruloides]|uniref:MFS monocarboxylate transporter n=1 Tax=Rhodotorula toruloides TaxID=5286 RepID=A0A511KNC4_RHOTO|nr:MFS monocarboxylate transporter [Rhodotorula toruloides]
MEESIELAAPRLALARGFDSRPPLSRSSSIGWSDFADSKSKSPLESRASTPIHHLPVLPSTPATEGAADAVGRGRGSREGSAGAVEEPVRQRMRRMSMGDEADHETSELPPVDRGRGAWSFVFAAFILETFIWGFSYSMPSVLVYLQTHEPWQQSSLAALSAIATVLLAVMFMVPILVITVFRRYPDYVKYVLWTSAFVNCLAMLASSWATKVWHLIVLQGVVLGLSGAALYAPVLLWLNSWFHMRRGLASGIVFAGTGVGGLIFPFIISTLLDRHGFATMCRVWAAITAAVYAIAVWLIRPRVPPTRPKGERGPWFATGDASFVKDPVVLTMTATSFVSSLAYFPVSLYLPTYTTSLASPLSANIVVAAFNLSSSIGSTVTGYASDLSVEWTIAVMGVCGAVLALTAWGLANSLGAVFAFAVLFSLFSQTCSCWGAAARDAAGQQPHLSTLVFCLFGIFRGIASCVGPFVATALYDPKAAQEHSSWGRYGFRKVIIFVGVMSFVNGRPAYVPARHR